MRIAILSVLSVLALSVLPAAGWDIRYTVVPLESERLPYAVETQATDISDSGWITGWIYNAPQSPSGGYMTTFSYHPTTGFLDIGNIPGMDTTGHGINDAGQISGTADPGGPSGRVAYRYTPGVGFEVLPTLPGSSTTYGVGINNRGRVVGDSDFPDESKRGFRYTDGVGLQDLGHLGGNYTTALRINEFGWVAGSSTFPDGGSHAYLWKDGVGMIDLGVGIGAALNNLGVVAGWSYDYQPLIFREGQEPVRVAGPPGMYYVSDINDQNVLVGTRYDNQGIPRAFLATEADGVILLNELIPPDSGWRLFDATAINNHGQIVAQGFANGAMWAVRLDPIPEPSGLALLGLGALVLWWARRRIASK